VNLWLLLPSIPCSLYILYSVGIYVVFKLIELSENLIFITSFVSLIISKLSGTNKLEMDLAAKKIAIFTSMLGMYPTENFTGERDNMRDSCLVS
jgi:hypothetical protein